MLVFLGFSLASAFMVLFLSPHSSAPLLHAAHSVCLNACPRSEHAALYSAVVCGANLNPASIRSAFINLGLIHVLVVSGSHFTVLESLARVSVLKIVQPRLRSALLFFILVLFTLMTNASPPILRAFFSWWTKVLSRRLAWNWTRFQALTLSGFLTIPFCKDTWALCSLFLSWLAAMALEEIDVVNLDENWKIRLRRTFIANAKVYLALIPALLPLAIPHPISILTNVVFAPIMGLILFPLSLLAFIFPPFVFFSDVAWSATVWIVTHASALMPHGFDRHRYPTELLVIYLGALTLAFTILKRRKLSRLQNACAAAIAVLLIAPAHANAKPASAFTVWNVGQGSWSTYQTSDDCVHFDIGGEFAPWKMIRHACREKRNALLISHWDFDHVSFAIQALRSLPNLCLYAAPFGHAPSDARAKFLEPVPKCERTQAVLVSKFAKELYPQAQVEKSSNGKSRVFVISQVLIPGDSGSSQERKWIARVQGNRVRVLIAGHHGSKTATSQKLIKGLRSLKLVIASARRERYDHPSPATLERLSRAHVALITTEDWGSITIAKAPRANR